MGNMKTAAHLPGSFLLLTYFWLPLKIKSCPLTYFSGCHFWPPLTFLALEHTSFELCIFQARRWKGKSHSFPTVCKTLKSVDICPPKPLHEDKISVFFKLDLFQKINYFCHKIAFFFGKFHSIGTSGRVSGILVPSFKALARRSLLGSKRDPPPPFLPPPPLWNRISRSDILAIRSAIRLDLNPIRTIHDSIQEERT